MKQTPKWLTYSNVISTLALFLVLGGATAFAAQKIGSNQLKPNSVTTAKIKKEAVTSAKIKKNAVTGKQINESTLGEVPSAANAGAVGGMHAGKLHFVSGPNAPKTTVFSADGLTLFAECVSEGLEFTGTTSVDNSEIYESGNYTNIYKGSFDDNFNIGDVEEIGANIGDGSQDEVQGQLVYSTPSGGEVTAEFYINDGKSYGGTSNCSVQGTVVYS